MNGQNGHSEYPHYSMVIEWSVADNAYLVTIPELGTYHTHGKTYAQAAREGQDLLETLVDDAHEKGKPLPAPQFFSYARWGEDEELADDIPEAAGLAQR